MPVQVKNNAYGQLSAGINSSVGSFTLSGGAGARFPTASVGAGTWFWVTLFNPTNDMEICKCTDRTGDTFTVTRGQDGTTARAFLAGETVELRPTAAIINDLITAIAAVDTATQTIAAAAKTTPIDADYVPLVDTAAANVLKKLTWASIKATLWAAFGGATAKAVPIDADSLSLYDSAATTVQSRVTWAVLKAAMLASVVAAANTFAAKNIFTGTMKVQQALEKITITAAAPTATQHFDWLTQAIQYFTTAGANNWTLNVRGDGATTLDSLMAVGESITLTIMATMTGTPYYATALNIDGAAVTPKWLGGIAPTAGDASCINVYSYTIVKTAGATFTAIASKAKTT